VAKGKTQVRKPQAAKAKSAKPKAPKQAKMAHREKP
jgi:hypothetical protein